MEYIFVCIDHRQSDPKKPNYERPTEYYQRMESDHGLIYEIGRRFKIVKWHRCFRVEDKVKALEFVFKFPEYIERPEIYTF